VSKSVFDAPLKIMDARGEYQGAGSVGIEHILRLSRTFDCTELLDKMYGITGLNGSLARRIGIPDYNKPVEEIWADMAQAALAELLLKDLALLAAEVNLAG
jgi:hypothetical protein